MKKWISHNQGLFVSLCIMTGLLVWTYGCQSKVKSPVSGQMVTRPELQLEVDTATRQLNNSVDDLKKRVQLSVQELDKQDAIKQKLYDFAAITAQQGTVNPTGVLTLLGSILAAGLGVDNRIKDKVIKNRPLNGTITNTG